MSAHVEPAAMTAKSAVEFLGCTTAWLCKMRQTGKGPAWRIEFGRIVYNTADLKAYKEGRTNRKKRAGMQRASINKLRLIQRDMAKLSRELMAVADILDGSKGRSKP